MKRIDKQDTDVTFDIALIVSRFNTEVTNLMLSSALTRLHERAFTERQITVVRVPGAVEIPLVASQLARQGRYAAIVTLGAVIRGETTHYELVSEQVSRGCQEVMLQTQLPIIFGILTTENEAQALDRLGGVHGNKAHDAIDSACEMVAVLQSL